MSIETEVKSVAEAVATEAKKVEGEVVAEVQKIEGTVVEKVKDVLDVLSADEKLLLRNIELVNLRAHIDAQRAAKSITNTETQFKDLLKGFQAKYDVPVTHAFDLMVQTFKKIESKL